MQMMNVNRGTSVVFLRAACSTPWQPCVCRDFTSDKIFTFALILLYAAINLILVIVHIRHRMNGLTPILILCFYFFGRILIRHSHLSFAFTLHTNGIAPLDFRIPRVG